MEFVVKEAVVLNEGLYGGVIEKIEYKTEPHEYTDVFVKENTTGYLIKYGCPSVVSEKSRLGRLLLNWVKLVKDAKIDPEKVLVGQGVTFMVILKDGYTHIVEDSIKPSQPVQQPQQPQQGGQTQ